MTTPAPTHFPHPPCTSPLPAYSHDEAMAWELGLVPSPTWSPLLSPPSGEDGLPVVESDFRRQMGPVFWSAGHYKTITGLLITQGVSYRDDVISTECHRRRERPGWDSNMTQLGTGIRDTCLAHHKVVFRCPICHTHTCYTLSGKNTTRSMMVRQESWICHDATLIPPKPHLNP